MVQPCNGILLVNQKEQTADTHETLAESKRYYVLCRVKEASLKRLHTV